MSDPWFSNYGQISFGVPDLHEAVRFWERQMGVGPWSLFHGLTFDAEYEGRRVSFPFDVAIGVHEHQLDRFAYSAYEGGMLCLTIGTAQVDLLNSDTLGLFIPSLANLIDGPQSMALGLRLQSPPTIVLGRNTFVDDGSGGTELGEPLLDIDFTALELDFFVRRRVGELISRLTSDVTQVRTLLTTTVAEILSSALSLVGAVVILLVLEPALLVLVLVLAPALLIVAVVASRPLRRLSMRVQDAIASSTPAFSASSGRDTCSSVLSDRS